MQSVSVAFVDDHPILREGLVSLFSADDRFEVSGSGGSASDAVALCKDTNLDVVVVDLQMPGNVFQAMAQIRELSPRTKVVAFTASDRVDNAIGALEAGASGYVLKGCLPHELTAAIESVLEGETFISPNLASKVISSLRSLQARKESRQTVLSIREAQVVRLLMRGKTNKEIGGQLRISEKTVKHYMTILMQKLEARNRVEVVLAAQKLSEFNSAVGSKNQPN